MRMFAAVCALALASATPAAVLAQPPAPPAQAPIPNVTLKLPPGFHATVVAEGLNDSVHGVVRHIVFRSANQLYVSTDQAGRRTPGVGIVALHLNAAHRVEQVRHFSTIDDGTAIGIHDGYLYAASPRTIYRIALAGQGLVPTAQPQAVVTDIPGRPAFAFDYSGHLYVTAPANGDVCDPKGTPRNAQAQGLKPCPILTTQAGIWRFDADKLDQKFSSGEHFATGFRDSNALTWSPVDSELYIAVYARDGAHRVWPKRISEAQAEHMADAMYEVTQGTNMGWPYTYWDNATGQRMLQPEYGGNDSSVVHNPKYAVPVAAFHAHVAPMDIAFYDAHRFPSKYYGGAFIAMHGADACDPADFSGGYDVVFVPMTESGTPGKPEVFASGFAGPTRADLCSKRAAYRPVAVAVAPDGSLYVADSKHGRIWRITYSER